MTNTEMLFWVLGNAMVYGLIYLYIFFNMVRVKRAIDKKFDMHDKQKRKAVIKDLMDENDRLQAEVHKLTVKAMSERIERARRSLKEH